MKYFRLEIIANLFPPRNIYHNMIIGVTDSGIGGLNLLASLIKAHCGERYLYLADNANLPYGKKSPQSLREIALKNAETLADMGANAILFGCNTLSVTALESVKKKVRPPVFGLLPRPELLYGRALLMTTPTTALFLPKITANVQLLTPPDLASLIDAEYPDTRLTERYLEPLLAPYADSESVYLGCSHYLYAKEIVAELIPHAKILDGVTPLAHLAHAVLPPCKGGGGEVDFLFTGRKESTRYRRILASLLE